MIDRAQFNQPPSLEWVRVGDIHIDYYDELTDTGYQRKTREDRVALIEANFSWLLFGTVSLNRRSDGRLFAFDGGHRTHAAREKFGQDQVVPAVVYNDLPREIEAWLFSEGQRTRSPITSIQQFHAQLQYDDPVALGIQRIASQHGFSVRSSGTTGNAISAVGSLRRVYEREGGEELLNRVLRIAAAAWDYRERVPGVMIDEISKVIVAADSTKQGLDEDRLIRVLRTLDPTGWRRRASERRRQLHAIIADEYNYRLTQGRRITFRAWAPSIGEGSSR